jgi:hypothetical protein
MKITKLTFKTQADFDTYSVATRRTGYQAKHEIRTPARFPCVGLEIVRGSDWMVQVSIETYIYLEDFQ